MDVEALQVFPMLYEQESMYASPWAVQTVNCQVGTYAGSCICSLFCSERHFAMCQVGGYSAGDYWSWKHWRDTLADVLPV